MKRIMSIIFVALALSAQLCAMKPAKHNFYKEPLLEHMQEEVSLLDQIEAPVRKIAIATTHAMRSPARKELRQLMKQLDQKVHDELSEDINIIMKSADNHAIKMASTRVLRKIEALKADAILAQTTKEAAIAVDAVSDELKPVVIDEQNQKISELEKNVQQKGYLSRLKNRVFGEEVSWAKAAFYSAVGVATLAGVYYGYQHTEDIKKWWSGEKESATKSSEEKSEQPSKQHQEKSEQTDITNYLNTTYKEDILKEADLSTKTIMMDQVAVIARQKLWKLEKVEKQLARLLNKASTEYEKQHLLAKIAENKVEQKQIAEDAHSLEGKWRQYYDEYCLFKDAQENRYKKYIGDNLSLEKDADRITESLQGKIQQIQQAQEEKTQREIQKILESRDGNVDTELSPADRINLYYGSTNNAATIIERLKDRASELKEVAQQVRDAKKAYEENPTEQNDEQWSNAWNNLGYFFNDIYESRYSWLTSVEKEEVQAELAKMLQDWNVSNDDLAY